MTTRAGELIAGVVDNYSSGIKAFLLDGDDATLDATGYGSSAMVFFRAADVLQYSARTVTNGMTITTSVVSPMTRTQNMVITVTESTAQQNIVSVKIEVYQPVTPPDVQNEDVAYDSASSPVWGLGYPGGSVASVANGWQYTFTRAPAGQIAGWISTTTTFLVHTVDVLGNQATATFAMTVTAPVVPIVFASAVETIAQTLVVEGFQAISLFPPTTLALRPSASFPDAIVQVLADAGFAQALSLFPRVPHPSASFPDAIVQVLADAGFAQALSLVPRVPYPSASFPDAIVQALADAGFAQALSLFPRVPYPSASFPDAIVQALADAGFETTTPLSSTAPAVFSFLLHQPELISLDEQSLFLFVPPFVPPPVPPPSPGPFVVGGGGGGYTAPAYCPPLPVPTCAYVIVVHPKKPGSKKKPSADIYSVAPPEPKKGRVFPQIKMRHLELIGMFIPEVRPHIVSGKMAARIMKLAARKNLLGPTGGAVMGGSAALASLLMLSQAELVETWKTGIVAGSGVALVELVMAQLYPGLLEKLKK